MENRKKRRPVGIQDVICVGILLLVLGVIISLAVFAGSLSRDKKRLTAENESLRQVASQAESLREELRQLESSEAQTEESPTEPETATETEAAVPRLESLQGLEPGSVIAPADLDTAQMERYFESAEILEEDPVFQRINGRSYYENPDIAIEDLRYLKVLHYNFDHQPQVGELIVHRQLAEEVMDIFQELYEAEYEIQSMYLVDNYWTGRASASDSASVDANNTSAFCYRVVPSGGTLSRHAYGCAIDLNPQQNPYVTYENGTPHWVHDNASPYIDRSAGLAHMISHEDLAYQIFSRYGYTWGGDWTNPQDYQHFEKNLD